jgi:iron complex outermembrane receptor protein
MSFRFRSILGVAAALSAISAALAVEAQALTHVTLPAQPLADALRALGIQTKTNVVFNPALVEGLQAPALNAPLSMDEALSRLLVGTGLTHQFLNERTVVLSSSQSKQPVSVPTSAVSGIAHRSFSLAQADGARSNSTPSIEGSEVRGDESTDSAAQQRDRSEIDEVIVTGTQIRGVRNETSPIIVIDRTQIEQSGYATVQQLIEALPQNFGGGYGGVSEDGRVGASPAATTNLESATGINLRGLGNTATLVLINGRRVAPAAYGSAVDISAIPATAIERVEVLTDGASAIYGAEAIGGVVNFILRSDYDGAETSVRFGSVTDGGLNELRVGQTLGTAWNGGSVLLGVQHYDRDALYSSERAFSRSAPEPTTLLPDVRRTSAMLSGRHRLNDALELFADGIYTSSRTQGSLVLVRPTDGERVGDMAYSADTSFTTFGTGVRYSFADDWQVSLNGTYSQQYGHGIGSGYAAYDIINKYVIWSTDLVASGSLFSLPGGDVKVALGVSYRDEDFSSFLIPQQMDRVVGRSVSAYSGELSVPVIGRDNVLPLAQRIVLSAAIRHDEYSDVGGTTNPKFGVVWTPRDGLDIRGTYGTSFRAPYASELVAQSSQDVVLNYLVPSPTGGGQVPILMRSGSQILQPEEAESWTAGFTWRPAFLPGMELAFNYYDVRHTNRIVTPDLDLSVLSRLNVYGPLVRVISSDAEAQEYVDGVVAGGGAFIDLTGTGVSGIRYVYNMQQQNVAAVEQSGFDVSLTYGFAIGANNFNAGLNAAFIQEILTSYGSGTDAVDRAGTFGNPVDFRLRGTFAWTRAHWTVSGALNYWGSYEDPATIPSTPIRHWATVDLTVRHTWDGVMAGGLLDGVSTVLSVNNLFDEDPPRVVSPGASYPAGYDAANASPLGRFIALELVKRW